MSTGWCAPACSPRAEAQRRQGRAERDPRSGPRERRHLSTAPMKTCTRSSSASSSSASGDLGKRLHTGPLAQRAGLARSAPVSQAPDSAPAAAAGGVIACAGQARGCRRRRADAVIHSPAPRAAGAGRALFSGARGGAAPRPRAAGVGVGRSRCDAAWIGRRRGDQLRHRYRRRSPGSSGFSRVVLNSIDASSDRDFVAGVSPRVRADVRAPQPAFGRPHHLLRRGARLLPAVGCVEHRQQHDAAEEKSRSAGAHSRQDGPHHRPPHRLAGDDERTAERLQQGSAGRQGSRSSTRKTTWPGALDTLVGVIDGLTIDEARARTAASGLLLATDVADYLVGKGMPFRQAHEVVGGMVRQLLARGA